MSDDELRELERLRGERDALSMAVCNFEMSASQGTPIRPASAPAAWPDGAPWAQVLGYLTSCAGRWDGDARLLGNLRAADIARGCREAVQAVTGLRVEADARRQSHDAMLAAVHANLDHLRAELATLREAAAPFAVMHLFADEELSRVPDRDALRLNDYDYRSATYGDARRLAAVLGGPDAPPE